MNEERERFYAWVSSEGRWYDDSYIESCAWEAWQARASQPDPRDARIAELEFILSDLVVWDAEWPSAFDNYDEVPESQIRDILVRSKAALSPKENQEGQG